MTTFCNFFLLIRVEITTNRRISITQYSGKHMINIREYYEDKNGGGLLPGKKVRLPAHFDSDSHQRLLVSD